MLTYEHHRNMAFHENIMHGGRFEAFLMNTVFADAQMVWVCIGETMFVTCTIFTNMHFCLLAKRTSAMEVRLAFKHLC